MNVHQAPKQCKTLLGGFLLLEKAVGSAFFKAAILIEGGIERIEIAAVQMLLRDAESVAETINMKYFLR